MTFEADPNEPIESLLLKVKVGAAEGATSQSRTTTFAIVPFSALLVRLARDAEKVTNRLVWLTWALIALTFGLLVFTAVLVWQGFK